MEVAEFLEIEEIKRLKYRYMRCVDMKLWDEMAEVFIPEATAAYSGGHYSYEGREAIIEWLKKGMGRDSLMTTHSVHQPEIELDGSDRATGVWKLEDIVVDVQFDVTINLIQRPRLGRGHVTLNVCAEDGLRALTVTRSHRADYRRARKVRWGDSWD